MLLLTGAGPASAASSSAASFLPSDLPSLVQWVDASRALYTDTGGTTPATANGNAVKNVPDWSGSGNVMTGSTGGVLRFDGGVRVIGFEGSLVNVNVTSGSLADFALHLFWRPVLPLSGFPVPLSLGAGNATPFLGPQWQNGVFETRDMTTAQTASAPYQVDDTYRYLAVFKTGTSLRVFLDGAEIGPSCTGTQAVGAEPAPATITRAGYGAGGETTFGNHATHRVAERCFYEAAQDPSVVVPQFMAYFAAKRPELASSDRQVAFVGDSLMSSLIVSSNNNTVPSLVGANSAKVNRFVSPARPSITVVQARTRVALDYAKFAVGTNPIAFVWLGTNDIAGGATGAATYTQLLGLVSDLRGVGFAKIPVGTMLPRGTDAAVETQRIDFNSRVNTGSANFDGIADFGADATIGLPGSQNNTTYYNGDKIHLILAGNNVAYPLAQTVIDALL